MILSFGACDVSSGVNKEKIFFKQKRRSETNFAKINNSLFCAQNSCFNVENVTKRFSLKI